MQGQSEPHHHLDLDKPCNICGNVGRKDVYNALVTCSKCCITREHVYCMRVLTRVIPQVWVCEECLLRNDIVTPKSVQGDESLDSQDIVLTAAPSKVCVDSQGLFHHNKLKPCETGKVKYLSVDEASRLSSGTQGTQGKGFHDRNNSRTAMPSKNVIPKSSISRVKVNSSFKLPVSEVRLSSGVQRKESHEKNDSRTVKPSGNVISKSSIPTVKANTSFKLSSHGGAQTIRKNDQQTSKTSKDKCGAKEVKILEPKKKEVKTQNANADYARNGDSYGSSTLMCTIPLITGQSLHAIAGKKSSLEERDLLDILPKLELYCRYLPSLEATWNGKFVFSDSATPGEFYGGFQAHPPCKIHYKAFEFSQKLPNGIQVKLLPRCSLWEDLFGDGSPDFHDISLYFFPADNTESSKKNYSCLFEFLETKNLVMRSYIDGVELLISTSKQLHVDSQKVIARSSTQYFLWGVFRCAKADQIVHKVHKDFPSLVSPMECACDGPSNMDNDLVVDMDIDMEGGRSVGTVDIIVSKELSGMPCGSPEKVNLGSATHQLERSKGKMANAKDEVDLPPGFEKIIMLNSSITEKKTGGVRNHMEEKIGFSGVWGGAVGACSPQPQGSPKAFSSKEGNQELASDLGHDPLTPNPLPLSGKDTKSRLNIEVEGNIAENPCRKRETKELKIKPNIDEHNDSRNAEGYARAKKPKMRCRLPYPTKIIKTENKTNRSIF